MGVRRRSGGGGGGGQGRARRGRGKGGGGGGSGGRRTHLEEEGVEALGGVVHRARVRRVEDRLLAVARQRHVDVPLGDLAARVAVAVDAHRAEVDQVDVEARLDDAAQHVVGGADVVVDGVPLRRRVALRVRRRALLGEVDHRVRLLVLEHLHEAVVLLREVQVHEAHLVARDGVPHVAARLGRRDRRERVGAELDVDLPPRQVVDDHHLVPLVRQVERRRPAAEAVAAEHEDLLLPAAVARRARRVRSRRLLDRRRRVHRHDRWPRRLRRWAVLRHAADAPAVHVDAPHEGGAAGAAKGRQKQCPGCHG